MRKIVTTVAMLVLVLTVSSDAFAQRDSGAKARGDNDSFWSARYAQGGSTNNSQIVRRSRTRFSRMRRAGRVNNVPPMVGQASAISTPATTPVSMNTSPSSVRPGRVNLLARVGSTSTSGKNSASKPPWMYQKTDPRRYNN